MKKIELLAPARDLACGRAALDSGADAVYIGGPAFGARAAAAVSLDDIRQLAEYAHFWQARVYLALNTLLRDEELDQARRLVESAWEAGVDALIIQDMALLEMDLPPLPLHASTQCHITTPEKARFLEQAGFRRLILGRELSLPEIEAIRAATQAELEFFVHGALCVCYSGRCTMSYAAGGRSGNRGDCAQPCRMHYDLLDDSGRVLIREKYLLSLKDLNLSPRLGDLLDRGITSFKIEGRLKDSTYIRNVVSYYRQELDREMSPRGLVKASQGECPADFIPDPARSFNRGFTTYFIAGTPDQPESPHTQKSLGQPLGKVAQVKLNYFRLEQPGDLQAGDGICFFDSENKLGGMYIEHVEEDQIYPRDIRFIRPGMVLYRNQDSRFDRLLDSPAQRSLPIKIEFRWMDEGFALCAEDAFGNTAEHFQPGTFEPARQAEQAEQALQRQLSRTGGTPYQVARLQVDWPEPRFIPLSTLNEARRTLLEKLSGQRRSSYIRQTFSLRSTTHPYPQSRLGYEDNVLNRLSRRFYERHGVSHIEPAAESGLDMKGRRVMTTRHCIRRMLGLCDRYPQASLLTLPHPPAGRLYLQDGRRKYRLEFACDRCEMEVWLEDENSRS